MCLDESGLSLRPQRCRMWAPRGQTPLLHANFNWSSLTVTAALTPRRMYFRVYPKATDQTQAIDFLAHLVRQIPCPLLLIWDRLPVHRGALVQQYLRSLDGWIQQEYLPAYAPELNPVEYVWADWKQHELPNLCPAGRSELSHLARRTLRRLSRRARLIPACWQHSGLDLSGSIFRGTQ